jgi:heme-degrading monooxygenase HmoA
MIAIFNRLPVNEGAAGQVIERFAQSRGHVQASPGFVSMEVLRSEGADEVLVITRWREDAFNFWVHSEEFCTPSAPAVPRLTITTVKE